MESRSSISTWPTFATTSDAQGHRQASPSTALDFLVAVAWSGTPIYHSLAVLGVQKLENLTVGKGGSSLVQKGRTECGKAVAVKQAMLFPDGLRPNKHNTHERYLRQICSELRILTHDQIKSHSNIIDLVGLCWNEVSGHADLALVLEYSSHGTLKAFLQSHVDLSHDFLLSLAAHVAAGLEVLHQNKICHGDVKTQNVLVFQNDDNFVAKVSDFSEAVIGLNDDPHGLVECSWGTRLLNAPEVRAGTLKRDIRCNIEAIARTDVYSFGLLVWETMKHGQSFFDRHWCSGNEGPVDVDLMEEYLDSLPHNGLLCKATEFVRDKFTGTMTGDRVLRIFEGSIHDDAQCRLPMVELHRILEGADGIARFNCFEVVEDSKGMQLGAWSTEHTILELFRYGSLNGILLENMPVSIQSRIAAELQDLATSTCTTPSSKWHAALCLSECYSLGFGVQYDKNKCLEWIFNAAKLGSSKALLWYDRIRMANLATITEDGDELPLLPLEDTLSEYTVENYLSRRIRLQIEVTRRQLEKLDTSTGRLDSNQLSQIEQRVQIFNERQFDEVSPLHVASFLGDDEQVLNLLKVREVDEVSSEGFTATHYACLGGHLATLELLLKKNASTQAIDNHGCTPLHLAFAFPDNDTKKAVTLLLQHGANPEARMTSSIAWEYHDMELYGNPLESAVQTRSHCLISALLPFTVNKLDSFGAAIYHGFWEIAETMIHHSGTDFVPEKGLLFRPSISREAFHWIAHGPDYLSAIRKTLVICNKYNLGSATEDYSLLIAYIVGIIWIDQFEVIAMCLDMLSDSVIKRTLPSGRSALSYAISKAKNQTIWEPVIKKFVGRYTTAELEVEVVNSGSYLHLAVLNDSTIAARILLEKGVSVDQPTFDGNGITPLEVCMSLGKSTQMFSLLLEYGADVIAEQKGVTPFENMLLSMQGRSQLLEAALQNVDIAAGLSETLHGQLNAVLALQPGHRRDALETFRILLGTDDASRYLNVCDRAGLTMVQKAAYFLNLESVALLLDAGADASIPYVSTVNGVHLMPLQIVCGRGRLVWWAFHTGQEEPAQRQQRDSVFKVAVELLDWHRARPNNPFEGLSRLHLACGIGDDEELKRLRASTYYDNHETVKGRWPGIEREVTPSEFADETLEREIIALASLRPIVDGMTQESATLSTR